MGQDGRRLVLQQKGEAIDRIGSQIAGHLIVETRGNDCSQQGCKTAHDTEAEAIMEYERGAAQRLGIQLPRARRMKSLQKRYDLAREAVSCNAVLGRNRLCTASQCGAPSTSTLD